ncbi:MAG: PhoX family protein, partial [Opitutales bacterium]|nr:PhoX family protein [Opitutales bacterium]
LQSDPLGRMRLPKGFSYKVFSQAGETMDDGFIVPGAHDGMDAFPGPNGLTLLVRNHEMKPLDSSDNPFSKSTAWKDLDTSKLYDAGKSGTQLHGGTTTLVFDTRTQELKRHYLSLAGTIRNCSGGSTPWGSWITCEETTVRAGEKLHKDHGYNFEVPANYQMGLAEPFALKEMGRFNHEAVAVHPANGVVYQTEDRPDGLIYRYIPNQRGQLSKGGKLQALAIKGSPSADTRNWAEMNQPAFPKNEPVKVEWIDIHDYESPNDDMRYVGHKAGAARFARGEGMFYGNGEIYFACTNGGTKKYGQIFRYKPSPNEGLAGEENDLGILELFIESQDLELLKACDNLTVAPWGDVVICEDDGGSSAIVGITPEGKMYKIAHVDMDSEVAGGCFSPDGTTFFVNIQRNPGQTLAITGPWRSRIG